MMEKEKEKETETETEINIIYPYVSIICVTYNRRIFIPFLLKCVNNQTYSHKQMELIVVDDGEDSVIDLFSKDNISEYDFNIKYYRLSSKVTLGEKRNYANTLINRMTKYITYFDDDDYHFPDRISHSVETLQNNTSYLCAGCTVLYVYYPGIKRLFQFGPYMKNHATAGTFFFDVDLLKMTKFNNNSWVAEESFFLKNYTIPIIQLNPLKTILVVSHTHNTVGKRIFVGKKNVNETYVCVDYFLRNKWSYEFYANLI